MIRTETYSPFSHALPEEPTLKKGKRLDDRFPEEARSVYLKVGVVSQASGSSYLEMDNTKIMCSVFGPRQDNRRSEFTEEGVVRCDVRYTPFATSKRRQPGMGCEDKALCNVVRSAIVGAILCETFPKTVVDVNILILQSDGGEAAGCITAASVALANAGIAMRDLVLAYEVGRVGGQLLLDPSLVEQHHSTGSILASLMPSTNEISQFTANGEWAPKELAEGTELAVDGCTQLDEMIRETLKEAYTNAKSG